MSEGVPGPSRTYHANQALYLSDIINLKFSGLRFGTERPRVLRVTEPDGPSTSGGRQARQAVLLFSTEDDDRASIVCGFIDAARRQAELRSYPVVKQSFESRFGRSLDLSRGEYNRMLDLLQEMLEGQAIQTRVINHGRQVSTSSIPRAESMPDQPSSAILQWLTIALAFAFGFFTCFLMMHYRLLR